MSYKEIISNEVQNIIKLDRELKLALNNFSLDELTDGFTYDDLKFLQNQCDILAGNGLYILSHQFSDEIERLKLEKYPEKQGVRYYKKYIDQLTIELTDNEKLELDLDLMLNCKPSYIYTGLTRLDIPYEKEQEILKELYEMGVIAPMIHVECDCGETIHTLNAEKEVSLFEKFDVTDKDGLYDEIFSMMYCDDCEDEYECTDRMAQEFIERYNDPQYFSRFKVSIKPDMTIDEL